MMPERWQPQAIFLYRHPVDMRKQIDGLVALVTTAMGRHPADRSLYVFRNRGNDKIKLLIWHRNGYWLLYKRLERQRFQWPDWFDDDALMLTQDQLDYLLDGYNLNGMRPHRKMTVAHAI